MIFDEEAGIFVENKSLIGKYKRPSEELLAKQEAAKQVTKDGTPRFSPSKKNPFKDFEKNYQKNSRPNSRRPNNFMKHQTTKSSRPWHRQKGQ